MQLHRTVTPSRRMAPIPTSDPSLTVAAWMVAPCPASGSQTASACLLDADSQQTPSQSLEQAPRTYGDIVPYCGWRLLPLRVVPRNMHHRPVLYVGVGANADGVHVSCACLVRAGAHACAVTRPCSRVTSLPRRMAPYHTDEPLPSVTSPTTLALGATKASDASVGRFPLYSCSVWCAGTAYATNAVCERPRGKCLPRMALPQRLGCVSQARRSWTQQQAGRTGFPVGVFALQTRSEAVHRMPCLPEDTAHATQDPQGHAPCASGPTHCCCLWDLSGEAAMLPERCSLCPSSV